jgi:hypothetical protein
MISEKRITFEFSDPLFDDEDCPLADVDPPAENALTFISTTTTITP